MKYSRKRIDKAGAVISTVKELREAYPSYFLNAREFIAALDEFRERCRVKGFVK